jgi:hypothetical protein
MGADMMAMFQALKDKSMNGKFVIETPLNKPINVKAYGQYRCHTLFRRLIGWLRGKGVTGNAPLHSLRKEYGSQINLRYGLMAASEMLRHANIAITASTYVEPKVRPVLNLPDLS